MAAPEVAWRLVFTIQYTGKTMIARNTIPRMVNGNPFAVRRGRGARALRFVVIARVTVHGLVRESDAHSSTAFREIAM